MTFAWLSPERRTASVIARDEQRAALGASSSLYAQPNNDNFSVIAQPSPTRDTRRFQEMKQNLQDFRQLAASDGGNTISISNNASSSSAASSLHRPPSLGRATTPSKTVVHADGQWARQQHYLGRPHQATSAVAGGIQTVSLMSNTGNPQPPPPAQQQQQQPLKVVVNGTTTSVPPASQEELSRIAADTANAEQVGRSLFEQQQSRLVQPKSAAAGAKRRVDTEERPAWVGPLDSSSGGFETPTRRGGGGGTSPGTSRRGAMTPTSTARAGRVSTRTRSGGTRNDVVHVLHDGRRVVYRGSTRQRLTEEQLYTGQSKARFAWKRDVEETLQSAAAAADHHDHRHTAAMATTPGQFAHGVEASLAWATPGQRGSAASVAGSDTPSAAASRRFQPPPPEASSMLYLMNGTGLAAEQLRRARTEGERRTAETLLKREAWKALHPGALEWSERQWHATLRPSATSGRGGAQDFGDAKNFAVYHKARPQWRFPAPQGPTMQQLREAPVVVNLSLEDLRISGAEEDGMAARAEQALLQKMYAASSHRHGVATDGAVSSAASTHMAMMMTVTRPSNESSQVLPQQQPQPQAGSSRAESPAARSTSGGGSTLLRPPMLGGGRGASAGSTSRGSSAASSFADEHSNTSSAALPPPPAFTYGNLSFDASQSQHRTASSSQQQAAAAAPATPLYFPEAKDFVSKGIKQWPSAQPPQQQQPFELPSQQYKRAVSAFAPAAQSVASIKHNPIKMRLDEQRSLSDAERQRFAAAPAAAPDLDALAREHSL